MSKSDKDYDSDFEQLIDDSMEYDAESTENDVADDSDITTDFEPTDVALSSDDGSHSLPLLALRDVVVYPHMQIALFVGREPSVKAIQEAQENFDELVLVVAQKDSLSEDIQLDNLYEYGTVCRIVSTMPHDSDENCIKVLIEGQYRAKLDKVTDAGDMLHGEFTPSEISLPMGESQQKTPLRHYAACLLTMLKRACVIVVN